MIIALGKSAESRLWVAENPDHRVNCSNHFKHPVQPTIHRFHNMNSLSYVTLDKTHFLFRSVSTMVEEKMMQSILDEEVAKDIMDLSFDPKEADKASMGSRKIVQSRDESLMQRLLSAVMNKIQGLRGLDESKIDTILDNVLNVIETIPLVLQDLCHATTNMQIVGALLRAFKMLTSHSLIMSVVDISGKLFDYAQKLTLDVAVKMFTSLQSGFEFSWIVKGARSILNGYSTIKNSACVKKVQKLLCYFLSFGMFTSFGLKFENFKFDELAEKRLRAKYDSAEGFVYTLLDTVVWFLERGMQCVKFGSIEPFFHSSASYVAWTDDAYRVREDSHKMANPEACGLDPHDFYKRLDACIEQGEAMCKYLEDASDKMMAKRLCSELRLIKSKFCSKDEAQKTRKPPFCVVVYGDTSIGKTNFTSMLFQQFGKVNGKDTNPENMWSRGPTDKFYSGFSRSKWCILMDDIAMFKPGNVLDPTLADVILIANGAGFVAPMADTEDKGVIPVRPDLVIATTNTKDLNAHAYFACPLAVRRRFPYVISLTVKSEYCADTLIDGINGTQIAAKSHMLDPAKVPSLDEGDYMDIWNIKLEKLVAVPNAQGASNPGFETIADFDNIYDFMAVFSALSQEYRRCQDRAMDAVHSMVSLEICQKCFRPKANHCTCEETEVQSGDIADRFAQFQLDGDTYFVEWYRQVHGLTRRGDSEDSAGEEVEIEEIDDADLADRRSWMTKMLDWADDQAVLVHTWARMAALGVKVSWTAAMDKVGEKASDLVVMYQLKKLQRVMGAAGDKLYQTFYDWRIAGFIAILVAAWPLVKTFQWFTSMFRHQSPYDHSVPSKDPEGLMNDEQFWGCMQEVYECVEQEQGGNAQSVPVSPSFMDADDKPNPWVKDEMILTDFFVPSGTSGWKNTGMSEKAVMERFQRNTIGFRAQYEESDGQHHTPGTAFCIAGHVYVTDNHCLPIAGDIQMFTSEEPETNNLGKNVSFKLDQKSIFRIPDKDLAFFYSVTPPRADYTRFFLKKPFADLKCRGAYSLCRWREMSDRVDVNNIHCEPNSVSEIDPAKKHTLWSGKPVGNTKFGDCGSPLVGFTPAGPIVLGLHQLAYNAGDVQVASAAVEILKEDIDQALAFFGPQIQCGLPDLAQVKLGPLHHKSVLRWPTKGQAHVYGTNVASTWRRGMKSMVVDTVISDAVVRHGFVKRCEPPVMKGPEIWFNNIEPTVTMDFQFSQKQLDACVFEFANDIISRLTPKQLSEIVVLDDMSTMNGYPGIKFLDKIKRQTSMGFPYKKSKMNFLENVTAEGYADAVMYVDDIMAEVEKVRAAYLRGERFMPVFVMNMKDEPIPHKKVEIKKTRGFMGGPAAWQFVVRQQLLSFVRIFQLNPFIFEGAPGMNCNSCAWDELHRYLTFFGDDQMVAGDYAKFDKRMSPQIILAAFRVIEEVLIAAGRDAEDLRFLRCIAEDVAYPLTEVQGDFVEFFGSNPSGHALTVIINCIANSLYMRYTYTDLNPVEKECRTFKQFVHLITYGDDNEFGVSRERVWFNHTAISEQLAKYGVVYTMADKEAASVPFVNIADTSFLKRKWRWDAEMRCFKCPLEWASIEKMLTTCVASKSICPEAQAVDTMRSAVGEFFQYGREVFEKNVAILKDVVVECHLQDWVQQSTFPTYDELITNHFESCVRPPHCSALHEQVILDKTLEGRNFDPWGLNDGFDL